MMSKAKVVIVVPIYNEAALLSTLFQRLGAMLDALVDCDAQVIFVNDGSSDQSLEMLLAQRVRDPRFTVIDFSRNFGHQAAITAGLAHARGDAAIVMDGDLQDPPELIPQLIDAWRDGGKIVLPVRRSRSEGGARGIGFAAFHKLFRWMSDFKMDGDTGVFGLFDRQALIEFNRLPERHRFIPGLRAWIGFEQRIVYYDRQDRLGGKPKQTGWRLLNYAFDAIVSFSLKPLRLLSLAGFIISSIGFALALVFVIKRLAGIETAGTGFTTLVTLILFLGGIQLLGIGLLGEYLGRVYDEAKQRPLYLIRSRHGLDSAFQERIVRPFAEGDLPSSR